MSNNNNSGIRININNRDDYNDEKTINLFNDIYTYAASIFDDEFFNSLPRIYVEVDNVEYEQSQRNRRNRNSGNTIENTLMGFFMNNLFDSEISDDRMLEIAMRESLDHYKTQEKKPNIKLCIEGYNVTDDMKDEQCTICISNYELGEKITKIKCNHNFHTYCISEWVKYKSECPVCRQLIDTIDEKN